MLFTYEGYASLLSLLRENGYEARNFHDYKDVKRSVVLRHDVDNTLQKALEIAKIEQIGGGKVYVLPDAFIRFLQCFFG